MKAAIRELPLARFDLVPVQDAQGSIQQPHAAARQRRCGPRAAENQGVACPGTEEAGEAAPCFSCSADDDDAFPPPAPSQQQATRQHLAVAHVAHVAPLRLGLVILHDLLPEDAVVARRFPAI